MLLGCSASVLWYCRIPVLQYCYASERMGSARIGRGASLTANENRGGELVKLAASV